MVSSENSCGIVNTPRGENVWVRACIDVRATKSCITENFNIGPFVQNIQHLIFPHPKVVPKETWESADGRNESRDTFWHLQLWKLLEQQFAKFQDPSIHFKIILARLSPCLQCYSQRGMDSIGTIFLTHPVTSAIIHNKLGCGPLQYIPPL